jgi:hypothetical protein
MQWLCWRYRKEERKIEAKEAATPHPLAHPPLLSLCPSTTPFTSIHADILTKGGCVNYGGEHQRLSSPVLRHDDGKWLPIHGVLMVLSWGVLSPIASLSAASR